jgi:branched-chain amino acid transport system substrate-binding protein
LTNKKRHLASVIAMLAVLLVACGDGAGTDTTAATTTTAAPTTQATTATTTETGEAPEAINVGAVIPLTGAFAGGGAQVDRGYRYAVDAINEAGGVMVEEFGGALPINLIIRDDASDPSQTVNQMQDLFANEDIVAYLGGFGSPLHAAAAAIAEQNQVPYLGVAFALQSIHEQGYRYLFSPFVKSPDIAVSAYEMLNALLEEDERPTRVAIFQESTDWGGELGPMWAEAAPEYGYDIVFHETYAPGTTDFSDLILGAQAADANALFTLPTPPDGFAMFQQMGELGWIPAFSVVVRAADVPTWLDLGEAGQGVFLSAGWHWALGYPGVDAINERHQAEEGRPADPIVGGAYSVIEILADAITRAGTLDHEAVRDALSATDMMSVAGPIQFRENGTIITNNPLMQRVENRIELIWPTEFATAEILYPNPASTTG